MTVLLASLLSVLAQAPATPPQQILGFDVFVQGQAVGAAKYTRKISDSGQETILDLNVGSADSSQRLVFDTSVDNTGKPTAKAYTQYADGKLMVAIHCNFLSDGTAHVVMQAQDKQAQRSFLPPPDANLADSSEEWFVKKKPAVGDKVILSSFNLQSLEWDDDTIVFVGDQTLTVNGEQVQAHHIHESSGTSKIDLFVDDSGLPYEIDQPGLKLVRHDDLKPAS